MRPRMQTTEARNGEFKLEGAARARSLATWLSEGKLPPRKGV